MFGFTHPPARHQADAADSQLERPELLPAVEGSALHACSTGVHRAEAMIGLDQIDDTDEADTSVMPADKSPDSFRGKRTRLNRYDPFA